MGTVNCLFAPLSYVTAPLLSTLIYLYSKLVPAGRLIVVVHNGFADVYWAADSAGAFAVFQLPSCEMEPASLTVWPKVVLVLELKVTATVEAGVAQAVAVAAEVEVEVEVEVVVVAGLLEVGGGEVPEPEPVILMSAQVR